MRVKPDRTMIESWPGLPIPPSGHFEQSRCAHASADAHGCHHEPDAATLTLDQRMSGEARARHAVGMSDRDRAAIDVEAIVVDAQFVAAVDHLHRERLVELP